MANSQPRLLGRPPDLENRDQRTERLVDRGSPLFLICQNLPRDMPRDTIRAAELRDGIMLARIKRQELETQARKQDHQRQFAEKFNQLVEAVNNFAVRYNQGQGAVWPQREADKLRKAMRQLQQLEKPLRDDPEPAPVQPVRSPAATPAR